MDNHDLKLTIKNPGKRPGLYYLDNKQGATIGAIRLGLRVLLILVVLVHSVY